MVEEKKVEEKKEEVKVPKHLEELVTKIEELKTKDLAELVKVLEDKFGVSAQAPVAMAAGVPAAGAAGTGEEEKSEFDVTLTSAGTSKISVIKVVKEITGKGLKDAKDVVDASEKEPQVLKEKVKKEEADEMKKKLEEAGAGVELK
jgi:large subunit ribosomal protein L7/L12